MPEAIKNFFQSYIRSFSAQDPNLMASHYTFPAVVVDSAGIQHFDSLSALAQKMTAYCDNFKAAGFGHAAYECHAHHSITDDVCFVDLEWSVQLAENALVYKTAYLLHKIDGAWKINNATVYEA